MTYYIISIISKNYSKAEIVLKDSTEIKNINGASSIGKVFVGDEVTFCEKTEKLSLYKKTSRFRKQFIPGIIQLNSAYRFGLSKNKAPIYLFKPLDSSLPNFMVASHCKKSLKFPYINQYALIIFGNWDGKIPRGFCQQIIGPITDCKNYEKLLPYYYDLMSKKYKKKLITIPEPLEKIFIEHTPAPSDRVYLSVDPSGCLDIDDVLSCTKTDYGFEIGIHIADVSSMLDFYSKHSDLLNFARHNGVTIYMRENKLPMIPFVLSHNLSSLKEGSKRLVVSLWLKVFVNKDNISIDRDDIRVEQNIIVNQHAISYDLAEKLCNKKHSNPLIDSCKNLFNLSSKIAKLYYPHIYNKLWDTHKMIELFMILTNHTIGKKLFEVNKTLPLLYRIHDTPLKRENPFNKDDKSYKLYDILQTKKAIYSINPKEYFHYGLRLEHYAHFTSPIRRYADLYTHMLVKNILIKKPILETLIDTIHLDIININEKEIRIKKMERDLHKIECIELISKQKKNLEIEGVFMESYRDFSVSIYFPTLELYLQLEVLSKKLQGKYEWIFEEDSYTIVDLLSKEIIATFTLYQKVKVIMVVLSQKEILSQKLSVNWIVPEIKLS